MTQIETFSEKKRHDCQCKVNEFLKTLGDVKVQVQYTPTIAYYEACVVYEIEDKETK